jgi:hypothetical protein
MIRNDNNTCFHYLLIANFSIPQQTITWDTIMDSFEGKMLILSPFFVKSYF